LKNSHYNVEFSSESFFDKEEIVTAIKERLKNNKKELFFFDFDLPDESAIIEELNRANSYYLTLFSEKNALLKNSVNIFPDVYQISKAVNAFCKLKPDSVVLLIDEYFSESIFAENLQGIVYEFPFKSSNEFKDNINEIIDVIQAYDPDYLILNINESDTIKILDSIVGYPRDKIFLLIQNTSYKISYYTGINSHGINGISVTDEPYSKDFSNKQEILKMVSKSFSEVLKIHGSFDLEKWTEYQNRLSGDLFKIKDGQIFTPLYHVKFTEDGFEMMGTYSFQTISGDL
jgi:hypothetical protein